jgi:hypothetical protein
MDSVRKYILPPLHTQEEPFQTAQFIEEAKYKPDFRLLPRATLPQARAIQRSFL